MTDGVTDDGTGRALGRTGILLVNLGTPEAPKTAEVRRYLGEFLADPRVLDISPVGRWLLLNLVILPFRSPKSANAYSKIWRDDGSPLLVHGKELADAVRAQVGDRYVVELAMRYGTPSIERGLSRLRDADCDEIVVLPLYPQYASSSTGSTVQKVYDVAGRLWNTPFITVAPPFYDDPGFIEAFAAVGRPVLDELDADHVLMSFHGLPERHMRKSDPTGKHCLANATCCDAIVSANRNCYRAQCFSTARGLAAALQLTDDRYTVTFQSRLGRDPWIQPYTDHVLPKLAQDGVKRLAVYCPAFVADCLETLEEIGMRAQEDFIAAGGEQLRLVPSLNAHPRWVEAVVAMVTRAAGRRSAA